MPVHLSARFLSAPPDADEEFRRALADLLALRVGLTGAEYLATEEGAEDFEAHVHGRLARNRNEIVPWVDSLRPLASSRVLEVGCGTGSSSLALAEQGATVLAIDVEQEPLALAEHRLRAAGADGVRFRRHTAAELAGLGAAGDFDVVMFFAVLEHLTLAERLSAIRQAWDLLPPGGMLQVFDTPNRLWPYDEHTSLAPYFHWLPDDLAIRYAGYTPRAGFAALGPEPTPDAHHSLARWGRGISFHDFCVALAIEPAAFPATTSLLEFQARPHWGMWPEDAVVVDTLRRFAPHIPVGFFLPSLDLAITKP